MGIKKIIQKLTSIFDFFSNDFLLERSLRWTKELPFFRNGIFVLRILATISIIFRIRLFGNIDFLFTLIPLIYLAVTIICYLLIYYWLKKYRSLFYSISYEKKENNLTQRNVWRFRLYSYVQIIIDIIFFSWMIHFINNPGTILFIFYFIPILSVVENGGSFGFICTLGLIMLGYFISIKIFNNYLNVLNEFSFYWNFFSRFGFISFLSIILFFLQHEERMQKSILFGLINLPKIGISIINKKKQLIWANEFETRFTGEKYHNNYCQDAFRHNESECIDCPMMESMRTGNYCSKIVSHKNGNVTKYFELHSTPLRNHTGDQYVIATLAIDKSKQESQRVQSSILENIKELTSFNNIDKPKWIDDVLERISASFLASDGLFGDRCIVFTIENNKLVGKIGSGPEFGETSNSYWSNYSRSYSQIITDVTSAYKINNLTKSIKTISFSREETELITEYFTDFSHNPILIQNKSCVPLDDLYEKLKSILINDEFLIIPIIFGDKLLGIIETERIGSKFENFIELEFVKSLAYQAAITLQAHRIREIELKEKELNKVIYDLINKQSNFIDLVNNIIYQAATLFQADGCVFYVPSEKTSEFVGRDSTSSYTPFLRLNLNTDTGLTRRVISSHLCELMNNYHVWPERDTRLDEDPFISLINNVLLIPIVFNDNCKGVLLIGRSSNIEFTQYDIELAERFKNTVSIIYTVSEMLEDFDKLFEQLPSAVIFADNKGKIKDYSRRAKEIFKYSDEEFVKKNVTDLYSGGYDRAHHIRELVNSSKNLEKSIYARITLLDKFQKEFEAQIRVSNVEKAGEIIGTIGRISPLDESGLSMKYYDHFGFLHDIEKSIPSKPITKIDDLREHLEYLLNMTVKYFDLQFIALYCSKKPNETVFEPFIVSGNEICNISDLPSFNWKNANILSKKNDPLKFNNEDEIIRNWTSDDEWKTKIIKGFGNRDNDFPKGIVAAAPYKLTNEYRSILFFGQNNIEEDTSKNKDFYSNLGLTIGIKALSWIQALYLERERFFAYRQTLLVLHRLRNELNAILDKFSVIKIISRYEYLLSELSDEGNLDTSQIQKIKELLNRVSYGKKGKEKYKENLAIYFENQLAEIHTIVNSSHSVVSSGSSKEISSKSDSGLLSVLNKLAEINFDIINYAIDGETRVEELKKIKELSETSILERQNLNIKKQNIAIFLENLLNSFEENLTNNKKLDFNINEIRNLPELEFDEYYFGTAINNLLSNADKYGFWGTTIYVYTNLETKYLTISIEDQGYNMPEEAKRNFTESGNRYIGIERARIIDGWGLGLWDSAQLIGLHNGKLEFSSDYIGKYGNERSYKVIVKISIPYKQ